MPKTTTKLLEDGMDFEAWLVGKLAASFRRAENVAFVTGDTGLRPRGFTTYPMAATADTTRPWGTMQYVASGVNGTFKGDKLYELVASLKTGYREKASFVASRATFSTIRQMKAGEGAYLFAPSADGPNTLLGFPCVDCEDMPAVATDAYPLAFGDFNAGYQIADRGAIKILRDPFTTKGQVLFYATKRVGGGVVNSEAIKFMKLSA